MDGISRFQEVVYITIPMISSTIIMLFIMQVGRIMSVGFEKVFLMYSPAVYETADVISTYVYKTGLGGTTNQMSYAAAIGLFNNVINGILLLVVNFASSKLSGGDHSLF